MSNTELYKLSIKLSMLPWLGKYYQVLLVLLTKS